MSAADDHPVSNAEPQGEAIAVTGLVTPAKRDENGEVSAVAIACGDKCKYIVHANPMVKALMQNVDELVRAEGFLRSDEDTGEECLTVESFEVLSDEWDDEDQGWDEEDEEDDGEWKKWKDDKQVVGMKSARQPKAGKYSVNHVPAIQTLKRI